jgi:hypothetical protein
LQTDDLRLKIRLEGVSRRLQSAVPSATLYKVQTGNQQGETQDAQED